MFKKCKKNKREEELEELKNINSEDITKGKKFSIWRKKAMHCLKDVSKAIITLGSAMQKLNENSDKGPLENIKDTVTIIINLAKDYLKGTYKKVSFSTVFLIMVGIVYFLSPIDIIPDFIVGLGFIDDATILGIIIKQIEKEIETYKEWKEGFKRETSNA